MAQSQPPNSRLPTDHWSRWEWLALTLILCLAAAVRLWRLSNIPPGFTHDEAGHGHDAVAILNGARPIYQTVGYGREPLYDYLLAGLMALFGPTGSVLRFSAVPLGLLTLLATFAWTRLAFDRPTALGATALQAASFWSLATSRQALRSGLLPALFALAIWFYWRAIGDGRKTSILAIPRPYNMALCALFIGATLYTYIPARVLWVIFPAFLVYLLLFRRDSFRRAWLPTLVAVLVGLLLAVPLFAYLRAHPQAEQRLAMLDEPLQALRTGDLSVILGRAWGCVAGFFIPGRGDDFLAYTIPGRPFFGPLTGVLFVAGLILCLVRWRKPACAFSLLWFIVGISPSLITGVSASTTRSIAALPAAYLFPALAVVKGARWAAARWGQRVAWAVGVGFVVLVVAVGVASAHDYFVAWGESPGVRAAYMQPLVEIAGYLGRVPVSGSVGISTYLPHAPHDPYVFDMSLRRYDRSTGSRQGLSLHWFDARRAIVFPPESSALLIVPAGVPLNPYFAALPGLMLHEHIPLRDDDLDPFFDVYDWQPQVAATALRDRMQGTLPGSASWVDFGGALHLVGYDLRTSEVAPGETVELVTLWHVVDPGPLRPHNLSNAEEDLVVFTHALDGAGGGDVVGQEDRLDAPAWDWQAGDVIAQIHRFTLLPDLAEGEVTLEVGVYRRSDGARLPVLVDGSVVGDSVLLQPLKVEDR